MLATKLESQTGTDYRPVAVILENKPRTTQNYIRFEIQYQTVYVSRIALLLKVIIKLHVSTID